MSRPTYFDVVADPLMATIFRDLDGELAAAFAKFPPFNSPHEGKAVIEEELDELWECVKENHGRSDEARKEALYVAAMALRYVYDLCTTNVPAHKRDPLADLPEETREAFIEMVAEMKNPKTGRCGCGFPQQPCLRVVLRNGPPFPLRPCEPVAGLPAESEEPSGD